MTEWKECAGVDLAARWSRRPSPGLHVGRCRAQHQSSPATIAGDNRGAARRSRSRSPKSCVDRRRVRRRSSPETIAGDERAAPVGGDCGRQRRRSPVSSSVTRTLYRSFPGSASIVADNHRWQQTWSPGLEGRAGIGPAARWPRRPYLGHRIRRCRTLCRSSPATIDGDDRGPPIAAAKHHLPCSNAKSETASCCKPAYELKAVLFLSNRGTVPV